MGQDNRSAVPDGGPFDPTRGSVVLAAVQGQAPGAPQALAELCARYWRPVRRRPVAKKSISAPLGSPWFFLVSLAFAYGQYRRPGLLR